MESHLLQMRGLKLYHFDKKVPRKRSHLLQMRGLKPVNSCYLKLCHAVASFTDAWIETPISLTVLQHYKSHLLQMRGLKQIWD